MASEPDPPPTPGEDSCKSVSHPRFGPEPGIRGKDLLGVATSTADNSETPIRNTNTPRFAGRS